MALENDQLKLFEIKQSKKGFQQKTIKIITPFVILSVAVVVWKIERKVTRLSEFVRNNKLATIFTLTTFVGLQVWQINQMFHGEIDEIQKFSAVRVIWWILSTSTLKN